MLSCLDFVGALTVTSWPTSGSMHGRFLWNFGAAWRLTAFLAFERKRRRAGKSVVPCDGGSDCRWNAKDSNRHKANETRTKSEVSSRCQSGSCAREDRSDEDYADAIGRYADRTLQQLMTWDWPGFQDVCRRLEEFFSKPPLQGEV